MIDDASCEARLNVFSPLGDSASTSFFFGGPDNFVLEDQGEVLKGRWISDISANVVFVKQ